MWWKWFLHNCNNCYGILIKLLIMSFGGTIEWMRTILLHKWRGVMARSITCRTADKSLREECQCPAVLDVSDRQMRADNCWMPLWKRGMHMGRCLALMCTHQKSQVPQPVHWSVMGAQFWPMSLSWSPVLVSARVNLWAFSWAQWELCTAHITLYMQSLWVHLSRERYIAMNCVFTPVTFTPGNQRQQKRKTTAQRQ